MGRKRSLILTVGVPGSGKSTWASEEQARRPHEVRIVTRDDIRFALGTRFEDDDEKLVFTIAEGAARLMLDKGYDVIVADTNLNGRVRRRWAQLAKTCSNAKDPVTVVERAFPMDLTTCLERVANRVANGGHDVPVEVIKRMHQQMEDYLS